ncbi:autotransporter outer membrane beta-barrel domain-containing protein [Campylobacter upsaliensis]|uniref:autotransporter outer membrane beta-barrel domain-containing protein n=1 Tax=Campylobacter upsaliensis TaxID=28080 RepID=UPI002B38D2A8|nr:autotransporter outer membrane beta-barrel domain-containing protein [Campylobacter upsaliensis]MEB2803904.1 autotransporter outer membrane beta-barrel domain-containing protein [Campylobacter upsaliensis]
MQAQTPSPMPPPNDPNNLSLNGKSNVFTMYWKTIAATGKFENDSMRPDTIGWRADNESYYGGTQRYYYQSTALRYQNLQKINWQFRQDAQVDYLSLDFKKESDTDNTTEQNMLMQDNRNKNLTIGTFDVKGDVKFEIKLGGKSTIDTLNNTAERLNIKVNNENGTDTLTISTLNQTTTGDSQIFKNVTIDTFNLQNGKSYQRGGSVGTLNLQGGEFHLGAKDDMSQAEHDGVVDNLVLQNGTFKQYKGEINNITLTSDKETASFTANNDFSNGSKGTYDGLISKVDKNTNGENTVTFGNNGGTITTTLTSGQLTIDNKKGDITNNGAVSSLDVSNKQGSAVVYNSNGASIEKLTSNDDSTIHNQGKISDLDFKGGSVNNHNSGEISKLDLKGGSLNNAGTITTLNNTNGTAINNEGTITTFTNTNKNTATIRNQGKITNGIINDGGILTVFNDFRKDESAADGYHTVGEIGKTANGVHIENKNGGKLNIPIWYFNKEDYATPEERKNNALLVDGDYAGITLENAFVNTQGLDVDKTYNIYTLIADKDGNIVGDKINNGQGIDVNKLYSVSGIYNFEGFGGKGEYRAIINRDELSGRTLAQSIIYSQRVRNVNLSRILREATTQVFVSGKESETNANGKSLGQLKQLHTNHRDENSQNHTFVIPYYQNFSADLGSETGKLKSNSSGMLIATQRELPNDYGVLGIYTGFENAEQKVNAQRLEMDGNSYYAGLTYNHSFYEDDLTTYFMNLTTKLDYIERDVTKTYLGYIGSVSSTAKVFGYGANARVGFSHYLKNDAKISPQIGFNYLGMHNKPFTLNHLGGTREHYLAQNFNFIDAVATIKYETPWINRFKTAVALGTIINVYKDAKGTLHLDSNVLNAELDIARLYGVVQGGISYDLTKDSDISLGYSGIFSSANTIRSHAFMFRYAWWW